MKFIQDKISDQGKLNYTASIHDSGTNADWSVKFGKEAANVVADPSACRVSYRWRTAKNGNVTYDGDQKLDLKDVTEMNVLAIEQYQQQIDTQAGFPNYVSRMIPSLFVLKVRHPKGMDNVFFFNDEDLANRVAKAMVHAVELCGGGNKEPF